MASLSCSNKYIHEPLFFSATLPPTGAEATETLDRWERRECSRMLMMRGERTIFYPSIAKCWWGIIVSLLDVKASVTWGGYRAIFQLLLGWWLNCDLIIYHHIDRRVHFGVLHIYKLCFFYCDQLIWIFAKQMYFTYFNYCKSINKAECEWVDSHSFPMVDREHHRCNTDD